MSAPASAWALDQGRARRRRRRPLIAELTGDERKVMEALLRGWLHESEAGRGILGRLSEDEAFDSLCGLIDRGLAKVRLVDDGGDSFGISISLVTAGGTA
jgi:hypothetical protein